MPDPLSTKQLQFILEANRRWNLAHGSVRTGKTVGTVFRFMQDADKCPDSKIYIVGHTFDTAYRNVVRLLMESEELSNILDMVLGKLLKGFVRDHRPSLL